MSDKSDLEQTHCLVNKVFAFTVPPLGSADGFKASLWPKQPIWVGRLRVVSRSGKCAVLLEHTDKDGLFASCPVMNDKTVEPAVDSSRYFVLRLSDGKGRHALIGIGFNDRAQAFDFKVALQDWENSNKEGGGLVESTGPKTDYSIPTGGSIHVNLAGGGGEKEKKKKRGSNPDIGSAFEGMKLSAPPGKGEDGKEKKKKKKKDKDDDLTASSAAKNVVGGGSANIIDFGFGDFGGSSSAAAKPASAAAANDPFAPNAAPSFGASSTPFDTPFDDTPDDWVKF